MTSYQEEQQLLVDLKGSFEWKLYSSPFILQTEVFKEFEQGRSRSGLKYFPALNVYDFVLVTVQ